jgi:hypothetical protein
MPVTAAAFAAKMQDATQATEGEMLGLMDVLQKNAYLGPIRITSWLASPMAGAMGLIRQKGKPTRRFPLAGHDESGRHDRRRQRWQRHQQGVSEAG